MASTADTAEDRIHEASRFVSFLVDAAAGGGLSALSESGVAGLHLLLIEVEDRLSPSAESLARAALSREAVIEGALLDTMKTRPAGGHVAKSGRVSVEIDEDLILEHAGALAVIGDLFHGPLNENAAARNRGEDPGSYVELSTDVLEGVVLTLARIEGTLREFLREPGKAGPADLPSAGTDH